MSSGGGARAPASARSKCSLDSAVPPLASSYADPRRGRWPLWEGDDEAGVAVSLGLAGEALAMASSRSCATRDSAASNSCTCVCVCVCVWVYVCVCVCVRRLKQAASLSATTSDPALPRPAAYLCL